MKIEANYLTLGEDPKYQYVGEPAVLRLNVSAAENINVNKGTRDNPDWQTIHTSWFILTAWDKVAEAMMDANLTKGDSINIKGMHKVVKKQYKNEKPKYFNEYKILEFKPNFRD